MRSALRGERERARQRRPRFLESLAAQSVPEGSEPEKEEERRRGRLRSVFRRR